MVVATTYKTIVLLIKVVVVVVKVTHEHHSLTVVLIYLAIDAIRLYAADVGIVNLTYLVAHKLYHLVFDAVAFSILSHLLHVGTVFAQFFVLLAVGRASAFLITGKQAVDHCVGIATDRRREVGIVFECQSEVSDVVSGVFRFHHGFQRHHLNKFCFVGTFTLADEGIHGPCCGILIACRLHAIAELHDELAQVFKFHRVWFIVDTVRQRLNRQLLSFRHLGFSYVFSHGTVGKEHELLYEFVGIFRTFEIGSCRFSCFVDVEMQFFGIEIDGSVLKPLGTKFLGNGIKRTDLFGILSLPPFLARERCRLPCAIDNTVALQQFLRLFVGIATVTANDGVHNAVVLDVGFFVENENNTIAEFFLVGT